MSDPPHERAARMPAVPRGSPASRRLYLLRHAKSSWDDPALEDRDRPLAPRGVRAAVRIARYAGRSGIRPDLVLCSPARRTRQTLDAVLQALGEGIDVRIEEDLYAASQELLLGRLHRVPRSVRSVMLVGHNPGMWDLAITLTRQGRPASLEDKFPTGALATLAIQGGWADLGVGEANLVDFVTPKTLT